jgi:hypothetical protein
MERVFHRKKNYSPSPRSSPVRGKGSFTLTSALSPQGRGRKRMGPLEGEEDHGKGFSEG